MPLAKAPGIVRSVAFILGAYRVSLIVFRTYWNMYLGIAVFSYALIVRPTITLCY